MLKYYTKIKDGNSLAEPLFASPLMGQNIIQLRHVKVSDAASEALMDFLADSKDLTKCWARHLIVDNCNLTDS